MLHRLEFRAMGCEMLAVVDAESQPSLLAKVPQWFEEWEQVLSRFRFDSELTRLNQTHARPVHVSTILWEVLQAARNAERMTDGLVTPTLLDAIIEAGYDRPFEILPPEIAFKGRHGDTALPVLATSQPLTAMTLDAAGRTVTLPLGMSLDFGGIAKGWAAHQAVKRLQAEGLEDLSPRRHGDAVAGGGALVNAGGDIAISGPRADGSPWPIGISDPFHPGAELETLFLNQCGVATSGKDRRRWMRNGVLQHHIIDPDTNQPADTDLLRVTVVAPNVMEAEAAAKAAFILGSRAGLEWIEAHPGFAALFIFDNGQVVYSDKMEDFL